MLEGRHHQHAPRIALVGEDLFGAVAVMHVEINQQHTLKAVRLIACSTAIAALLKSRTPSRDDARRDGRADGCCRTHAAHHQRTPDQQP